MKHPTLAETIKQLEKKTNGSSMWSNKPFKPGLFEHNTAMLKTIREFEKH